MHTIHMIILFQLFPSLLEKGSGKVHGRGRTQSRVKERLSRINCTDDETLLV